NRGPRRQSGHHVQPDLVITLTHRCAILLRCRRSDPRTENHRSAGRHSPDTGSEDAGGTESGNHPSSPNDPRRPREEGEHPGHRPLPLPLIAVLTIVSTPHQNSRPHTDTARKNPRNTHTWPYSTDHSISLSRFANATINPASPRTKDT